MQRPASAAFLLSTASPSVRAAFHHPPRPHAPREHFDPPLPQGPGPKAADAAEVAHVAEGSSSEETGVALTAEQTSQWSVMECGALLFLGKDSTVKLLRTKFVQSGRDFPSSTLLLTMSLWTDHFTFGALVASSVEWGYK